MADHPSALFRTEPFTVTVDGRDYVFPHIAADRWMDMLSRPDWVSRVFHLLDDDSYSRFVDLAESGDVGVEELKRLVFAVLSEAAGRPWWEALRLAGSVNHSMPLAGAVLMRGLDPSRITLAAFLAVVWSVIMQNKSGTERAQAEMELSMPHEDATEDDIPEPDMGDLVARMRAAPGISVG